MPTVDSNDIRPGMKLEIDRVPYNVVEATFVKPGKAQPFTKARIKNLFSGKVIEKTWKSTDSVDVADVSEMDMRALYDSGDGYVFMEDATSDQITVPEKALESVRQWLVDDLLYHIVFYKGEVIDVTPPTFMELEITQADPGVRGDTASGRVMKPCVLSSGAKIQIPIFIEQGEIIKVDTRTGEYVSRVSK